MTTEIDPTQFGATRVEIDPTQFGAIANIDTKAGAPISVRNAVAASVTPQDKLSTLRSYYPDARSWEGDNYLYTDPKTGNSTLFNPKGFDMGDVSEQGRLIAEFLGGAIGGTTAMVGGQLGPQIATPEEIVTVPLAVGAGAAAGGQAYDAFAGIFYPHEDTRGVVERVGAAGVDVLGNAVGQRAGDVLGQLMQKGVSKGSELARASAGEMGEAFRAMKASPTAGAISGSKTIQLIENALSRLPASADIIGKSSMKLIDDIGAYAENIARQGSPVAGRDIAGGKIKKGAETFVRRFKDKAKVLYNDVDNYIPRSTRITGNSLRSQLDELNEQFAADPEFGELLKKPFMKKIETALGASEKRGGMTYGTLKALRTEIGNMMDDPLLADVSQANVKRIYGALTDDMLDAARKATDIDDYLTGGKSEALKAVERANTFWAAGRARIDDVLQPVVDKALSEEVFSAALRGAKNGPSRLRALKKSLPADDWNYLVGQQIRQMGKAKPGAQNVVGDKFSPSTFLTEYAKLVESGSANILFSGKRYRGLEKAVKNLSRVSAGLKEAEKMANTSNTAQSLIVMQMLTGGFGGAAIGDAEGDNVGRRAVQGAAFATLGPAAMAKLITSPKFINWLADAGSIAANPNGIAAHLGRLGAIAAKDEVLAPAIYEYLDSLQTGGQQ